MNGIGEAQLVTIIATVGWLVLVAGAYRSYRVDTAKTVRMALTWGAIFAGIAILFGLLIG